MQSKRGSDGRCTVQVRKVVDTDSQGSIGPPKGR